MEEAVEMIDSGPARQERRGFRELCSGRRSTRSSERPDPDRVQPDHRSGGQNTVLLVARFEKFRRQAGHVEDAFGRVARSGVVLATLLIAFWAAGAHSADPSSTPSAAGHVAVGPIGPVALAAGESFAVHVPVRVADGHRVQANPASSEFLVPLELDFTALEGLLMGEPTYPLAEVYLLEGSDEPLLTYSGEFEVIVTVTAADDVPPGEIAVPAMLHYQACNSRMCLFPASVPVEVQIVVSAPDDRSDS